MSQQFQRFENEEDVALVERARDGDSDAFGELVIRYAERLTGFVYRQVGDAESARDITQSAFLKAWQNVHSLTTTNHFRAWLFQIARNETTDFFRQRQRRPLPQSKNDATDVEHIRGDQQTPERDLVAEEERAAVLKALQSLPDQQRTVFEMRHFQGLSNSEIAEVLSCSTNAVKANLSYALKTLRTKLTGDGKDG